MYIYIYIYICICRLVTSTCTIPCTYANHIRLSYIIDLLPLLVGHLEVLVDNADDLQTELLRRVVMVVVIMIIV